MSPLPLRVLLSGDRLFSQSSNPDRAVAVLSCAMFSRPMANARASRLSISAEFDPSCNPPALCRSASEAVGSHAGTDRR